MPEPHTPEKVYADHEKLEIYIAKKHIMRSKLARAIGRTGAWMTLICNGKTPLYPDMKERLEKELKIKFSDIKIEEL